MANHHVADEHLESALVQAAARADGSRPGERYAGNKPGIQPGTPLISEPPHHLATSWGT